MGRVVVAGQRVRSKRRGRVLGRLTRSHGCTPALVGAAIPPVLDGIVAAAVVQQPRDLGPFFADLVDQLLDHLALLLGDWALVETGLEVLVVALPALLGAAHFELRGDFDPVLGPELLYQLQQRSVLVTGPRSLLDVLVHGLLWLLSTSLENFVLCLFRFYTIA